VRVTWIQPEDLVGYELRQASEEGKDVTAIAARWQAAGGPDAPQGGASPVPARSELRRLAAELLAELEELPRPLAGDEPDELDAILAESEPTRLRLAGEHELATRVRGAWLGRAVGCLLGKPVEKIPREGIRELLESNGRWPLAGYFTAEGVPSEVAARWPWNRASAPTSLAEVIDGMPEDDDLNWTMLGVALLERAGARFTTEDVAKIWLDLQPAGRIFTAERIALRNLLLALDPPRTATHANPFREWIGARIRVDAYGWAAGGDIHEAARMAWEDARLSHTANGVYAAMFMAAAHAGSLGGLSAAECVDAGADVVPRRSRLAEALRTARDLAAGDGDWEAVVDGLYERYGSYHWVHAINNTALVAAALRRYADDFAGGICAVVAGGWDTDSNGAAVGSILGACLGPEAIAPHWAEPLHDRIASSLPGFGDVRIEELARRTIALCSRSGSRSAAVA
jgi:ADP-ribosylglycohydrolase